MPLAGLLLGPVAMSLIRAAVPLSLLALSACSSDPDGPDGRVLAKTTQLVQYASCSALEADLKQMVTYEIWADIDVAGHWGWGFGAEEDAGAPTSTGDDGGGRQEGVDYSGTNNQEEGVDEADFVKTDGYHIYTLNGNRVHIMGVPEFGQLTAVSETKIEGHPRQMLLDSEQNRLVVFSAIDAYALPAEHPLRVALQITDDANDTSYWRIPNLTKITVLDITDKAAPQLVREVFYEGWYQTARKINSSIRMAGYSWIEPAIMWGWWRIYENTGYNEAATKAAVAKLIDKMTLADFIPQIYVRTPNGHFETNSLSDGACRSFYRPTDSHARGISSIISFDLLGNSLHWDADHVISNWATFYASQDRLVLAERAHDWWWYWWYETDPEQLNIHTFDISVPGQTRYEGSGRVEGTIVDQFSLDEEEGAIRVATTTGFWSRWWLDTEDAPELETHVWVLEDVGPRLEIVGHLGGIAPGERIMSSRFQGDKGYLVTFEFIDPLFTLDLSDNTNPRIVGELKIPGFSTYLHPIADGKLLSIGIDGQQSWRTQVSLFDISDFANPTLQQALPVDADDSWGWSEALYDHKAFQYWAPKKLLAIPQSTYDSSYEGGTYHYRYYSHLVLVNVDPVTGLSEKGRIDHSPYYAADPDTWWIYRDIRRSIFMGDYVYAISDKAITAHRLSDLGTVAAQVLPGYTPSDYYWWW